MKNIDVLNKEGYMIRVRFIKTNRISFYLRRVIIRNYMYIIINL